MKHVLSRFPETGALGGGSPSPRSVHNLPALEGRGAPCRGITFQLMEPNFPDVRSFPSAVLPLRPHLAMVTNDVLRCFILRLTLFWKAPGLTDSKLQKGRGSRNMALGSGPGKTWRCRNTKLQCPCLLWLWCFGAASWGDLFVLQVGLVARSDIRTDTWMDPRGPFENQQLQDFSGLLEMMKSIVCGSVSSFPKQMHMKKDINFSEITSAKK